jgi:hypothetical protein
MKYDFFIAGRWRNKKQVKKVLDLVRNCGKSAYCFIENDYKGDKVEFKYSDDTEKVMEKFENIDQNDPYIKKIFRNDYINEKNSKAFLLVLPAGISGHIEAGIAYGLGKRCFAIGKIEKTETLYNIFERIFSGYDELDEFLENTKI